MHSRSFPRRALRPFSPAAILRAFLQRRALRQSRRRLAQLDDHLLQDIGLSREEALREADRPDWNAPAHWTC